MDSNKRTVGQGWQSGTEKVVACYQEPGNAKGDEKLYVILEAKDNANQRVQFTATIPQHEFIKALTDSDNFRIETNQAQRLAA